ncbi:MAG: S-layer homology domain-containing protein, partial [Clostridia bacterium]|nr:S-layer homology domain-containing protein [Clostridia bacterium]
LKEKVEGIPYMRNRFEGAFAPDEAGTRYEIIEALAILFDIEKTGKKCEFTDVDKKYKENVELFFGADIIAGYPDGTFGGEKGITRAEFVKILYVMLKLEDAQSSDETFSDINGHWGEKYIKGFVKEGYISGYPDGTFKPDNNITRAEIVTIINRIIKAEAKDTLTANDVPDKHWAYEEIKKAALEN